MTTRYYLGVDGGQSSTTALIGDDSGCVLGYGSGAPCYLLQDALSGSLASACKQAGLALGDVQFASACLGFSGGAEGKEAIVRSIVKADKLTLTHDASIALSGSLADIIVIAGTGSMAFGRNAAGRTARAGGWGFVFGDEGGGFDLARQALRAALRFEEGWGPPTALLGILLAETGSGTANELLHRCYTPEFSRPVFAGYSKLVDQAAEAGDAVAQQILKNAAQELALLAQAVRETLFRTEDQPAVAYAGAVFRSRILLRHFRAAQPHAMAPVYGPAAGALLEAYRADGNMSELSQLPEIEK